MASSDPSMPPADPTSQPTPPPGAGGPPQDGGDVSVTIPLAGLVALHAVVTQLAQGVDAILKQAQGQAGAGAPPPGAGAPPPGAGGPPSPDLAAGGPPGGAAPGGSPEDEDVLNDIRSSSR